MTRARVVVTDVRRQSDLNNNKKEEVET